MYMKLEATIISWEQSDRAYLGTLGDTLPESSNRGQVQLDEIQPVPSNEVLHQVEKTFSHSATFILRYRLHNVLIAKTWGDKI